MAIPDIPLATGKEATYVLNGEDISLWVTNFEFDSERNVVESEGSGNSPTKRRPTGKTHSLTFTVENHPTPLAILEPAYYDDPQPVLTFVVTRGGREKTYQVQISHLTDTGGPGDALTYDVEATVSADPT
jgi:hypothetical protein